MSPSTPTNESSLPPAPISPGGTYTLDMVGVGCKIHIRRPLPEGGMEERLAEILSIRDKPVNPYSRRATRAGANAGGSTPEDNWEFFVHWDTFNKRLDDWVPGSRLVLTRDLEHPRPKPPPGKKKGASAHKEKAPGKVPRGKALLRKATSNAAAAASASVGVFASPAPSPAPHSPSPGLKRKTLHGEEEEEEEEEGDEDADADADGEMDAEGEMDVDGDGETFELSVTPAPPGGGKGMGAGRGKGKGQGKALGIFSKEQEIEKLRTSGSMTQSISEIARVKNLNRLQIGRHEVEAWYFSPYPKEYAHIDVLYICEFCLSFFPSPVMLSRHRKRCTLLHPPGNEIYRDEDISFFEIDGKRQLTFCRNLSLLSKCFLDHKTLYYDVTPFLYYVMTQRDSAGCHIIGYFSKEKESAENYNVACILTLPQHQRYGYGKLLIEFSYELSKKEGKLGSPEKPLSDLGLLSYRAYWAETIVELLLNANDELSIDDIAQKTSITHADIMNTCTTLQLFKHYKGQHIICLSDTIVERHEKARNKRRRRIRADKLIWKPPVFTRDQLRFGW